MHTYKALMPMSQLLLVHDIHIELVYTKQVFYTLVPVVS